MVHCFVSYTSADSAWAEWVAAVLRDGGHRVTIQATDFLPGDNFVLRMQEAASESDHTIVVLSENFLRSRFGAAEWAAAFVHDPTGRNRRLIPVAVDDVSPPGLWSAIVRVSIVGLSEDEAREQVLNAVAPGARPSPAFPGRAARREEPPGVESSVEGVSGSRPKVDVWRLPTPAAAMIGRSNETEELTRAWLSTRQNVVTVAGWGGVGKTTLVGHWLAEMAAYQYHGARNIFAWSFDGQSDGENWATSDQFFDALARFLDVDNSGTPSTTRERCRAIVTRLQQERSLVVLDGLERVQHPPGALGGTFREPVMQMFIRELAALNPGMLVLTTRLPIIDVDAYVGRTCSTIAMPSLSRAESVEILTSCGVRGDVSALSLIAEEVRDHPLSLRLLSGYLRTVYDGDARMWESSGLSKAISADGGNASAIMDQYANWFSGRPELQLLQLLGLFNREATEEEIAALREVPVLVGLNDQLSAMTRAEMAYVLDSLRRTGLIESTNRDLVESHPLVREYFQRQFRSRFPEAFAEGHRRLRDLLAAKSPDRPVDLTECVPVVNAIWHATRAGDNMDALDELYWPRLAQDHHYLRDVVGAAASNYAVLSYLLDEPGGEALDTLSRARLLADQSLDLRMMGNTVEAQFPLLAAVQATRSLGDESHLVNQLRHLSQLQLTLGKVDVACRSAEEAMQLTGTRPTGDLEALSARTSYAYCLLQAGRYQAAYNSIVECGLLDRDAAERFAGVAHRVTFCIAVYRACDTVLGLGRVWDSSSTGSSVLLDNAREIVSSASSSASPDQLGQALLGLAGQRVGMRGAGGPVAADALRPLVASIRQVGQRPWIIEASLVLCRSLLAQGDSAEAAAMADDALRLAVEDGAVLQELQCRLAAARAAKAQSGADQPFEAQLSRIAADASRLGLIYLDDTTRRI